MIDLDVVVIACVLVNAAGLVAAALVVQRPRANPKGPSLLSFAVGVLLGTVLLDLLPHLWEATGNLAAVMGLFAAALLASRLFDNVCACTRISIACHASNEHNHQGGSVRARGAELLLLGDFVHSVVDGALIGAAFAVGVVPGAVAAIAVAIHEVPRRIAIVTLLMRAGRRPASALGLAVCAGMGTVLGGALVWWSAESFRLVLPVALALSAAAMLYVALAQSAHVLGAWRARILTLECGLPFLTGILIIHASHHVLELFG